MTLDQQESDLAAAERRVLALISRYGPMGQTALTGELCTFRTVNVPRLLLGMFRRGLVNRQWRNGWVYMPEKMMTLPVEVPS